LKRIIYIYFGLSALCVFNTVSAQSKLFNQASIRADMNYGRALPEYKFFNYLVHQPVVGFELGFNKKTLGKTIWEQVYNYPEYGLNLSFTTLGNNKIFGQEWAIYPYFQLHSIRLPKFQLLHQLGLGVGFATKKFDLIDNYQNVAVGSHVNIHFNYKLAFRFKLNDYFSVNTGLSFAHYSNGNTAEPNLGVNLLSVFTGLNYALAKPETINRLEIPKHERQHEMAFIYAIGGKHTRALQSKYYFTSSLSLEYKYHWKRKLHIGVGTDLFYDSSTQTELKAPGKPAYHPIFSYRTGIHLSQEMVFERFSFTLQEGYYLGLTNHVDNSKIYNRAILRWKFNQHFFMNISMKSHLHILDYPELGFGYFFTRKA
jgi:Lipid A 3-O-deacylase (PagL)